VRWSLDRADTSLSVPLSTQVYKKVSVSLILGGKSALYDELAFHPGGVDILVVAYMLHNPGQFKLRRYGPLHFSSTFYYLCIWREGVIGSFPI